MWMQQQYDLFKKSYFNVSYRRCMLHTLAWRRAGLGDNMAILLTSLLFLFKISFLPKYCVNYYDYIITSRLPGFAREEGREGEGGRERGGGEGTKPNLFSFNAMWTSLAWTMTNLSYLLQCEDHECWWWWSGSWSDVGTLRRRIRGISGACPPTLRPLPLWGQWPGAQVQDPQVWLLTFSPIRLIHKFSRARQPLSSNKYLIIPCVLYKLFHSAVAIYSVRVIVTYAVVAFT